jgi:hypothetical protein
MGVFDYISVMHPSMPGHHRHASFQTKDLERGMNYYELREDGVLWHKMCSYDWVDDPASPFGGHSKIRDVKWLPKTDVEGSVEIHANWKNGIWLSYLLMFEDGKFIKCIPSKDMPL